MSYKQDIRDKISTVNSTESILPSLGVFTGQWEDVSNYSSIGVAVLTDNVTSGTLYMDVSMDGGTNFISIPFNVANSTFNLPRVINRIESHIRIRYVNGTTAQTGFFRLQTVFKIDGNLDLAFPVGDTINSENNVTLNKSVITGEVLDDNLIQTGVYENTALLSNGALKTAIPPTVLFEKIRPVDPVIPTGSAITVDPVLNVESNVIDSGWIPTSSYGGGSLINIISDTSLIVYVLNSSDELGNNIQGDSVPTLVSQAGLSATVGAAFFDKYFRVIIVNTSGVSANEYSVRASGYQTSVPPVLTSIEQPVLGFYPAPINRSVSVGKNPDGSYINTPASGKDTVNSTNTPLSSTDSFTGGWCDVTSFGEIKVAMNTDVPGTALLQLSHDGVNVDTSLSLPPQFNTATSDYRFIHSLNPSLPYYRVVYNNGNTGQSVFELTTLLLTNSGNGFVGRATQVLDRYTDVKNQRIVNNPVDDRNFGLINYQNQERKFGYNESVGNGAFEMIWAGAYLGGSLNYVFPQTARNIRVKAGGNANDSSTGTGARTIRVFGLDENWEEIEEVLTLSGTLAGPTSTNLFIRINRVQVESVGSYGGDNIGDIVIESLTDLIELAYIPAGFGNTQQCIYSVPADKTAYITKIKVSVGQNNSADIRLFNIESRDDITVPFGPKHFEWGVEDYSGANNFELDTYLKIEEKNDIYADAKRITGSGTARISFDFEFILVDNV